jgi:hypothetical protein
VVDLLLDPAGATSAVQQASMWDGIAVVAGWFVTLRLCGGGCTAQGGEMRTAATCWR